MIPAKLNIYGEPKKLSKDKIKKLKKPEAK
jgi:hypothetical protein